MEVWRGTSVDIPEPGDCCRIGTHVVMAIGRNGANLNREEVTMNSFPDLAALGKPEAPKKFLSAVESLLPPSRVREVAPVRSDQRVCLPTELRVGLLLFSRMA